MLAALLTNLPQESPSIAPPIAPLGWVWPDQPDEETRKRQARRSTTQTQPEARTDEFQPDDTQTREDTETGAFSTKDLLGLPYEIPSGNIPADGSIAVSGDVSGLMEMSRRAGLEREMARAILDEDEAMMLIILAACS